MGGHSAPGQGHHGLEADPEAIDRWTREEFPAIRTAVEVKDAVVMFADQVGARSDHLSRRTWGKRGRTPGVAATGQRFGLNAMSAISTTGKLHFTILSGRFDTDSSLAFFTTLIGHDRIELHFLPAYAPHLNPDELVNADLKR